jgi:hypothetical protein
LLFKSKLGPIRVFEAGDTHRIKGTKIECRKVLDRDAMGQQVDESPAPQFSKSRLATNEGLTNFSSPNTAQWADQKSSRTSAMDTTVNTDHGHNSHQTSARKTLRNTGQIFKFPQEYQQMQDDSFLSYHEQNDYRNQYFSPMQVLDFNKQSMKQVIAGETQARIANSSANYSQSPAAGILDFLDEEENDPWPQDRQSRLTYVPGTIDEGENDPFEDQDHQGQKFEEKCLEAMPNKKEHSQF